MYKKEENIFSICMTVKTRIKNIYIVDKKTVKNNFFLVKMVKKFC